MERESDVIRMRAFDSEKAERKGKPLPAFPRESIVIFLFSYSKIVVKKSSQKITVVNFFSHN